VLTGRQSCRFILVTVFVFLASANLTQSKIKTLTKTLKEPIKLKCCTTGGRLIYKYRVSFAAVTYQVSTISAKWKSVEI
jgi:hypothetical protein